MPESDQIKVKKAAAPRLVRDMMPLLSMLAWLMFYVAVLSVL